MGVSGGRPLPAWVSTGGGGQAAVVGRQGAVLTGGVLTLESPVWLSSTHLPGCKTASIVLDGLCSMQGVCHMWTPRGVIISMAAHVIKQWLYVAKAAGDAHP